MLHTQIGWRHQTSMVAHGRRLLCAARGAVALCTKRGLSPGLALALVGLLAAQVAPLALAAPPDSGMLLDGFRTAPQLTLPKGSVHLDNAIDASAPPAGSDGQRVTVKRFVLEGTRQVSSDALRPLLAEVTEREVTLAELLHAVRRITDYYHQRGYFMARAYLPPQTSSDGSIKVTVLEGTYGAITVQPGDRLERERLEALLATHGVKPGAVAEQSDLERGMLLAEDIYGSVISAEIQRGATLGTADLALRSQTPGPVIGNVSADNHGVRYSGQARLSAGVALVSPFGYGDQASLRAVHTDGSDYGLAGYQLPLGHDGVKVGISHSEMTYRLCCQFESLGLRGRSRVDSLQASYPLVLTQRQVVRLGFNHDRKALVDDAAPGNVSDKRVAASYLNLNGVWVEPQRQHQIDILLGWGRLDLGRNAASQAADQTSARSEGHFSRLTANYALRQLFASGQSLSVRVSGQFAGKNLDSSEKFVLGGINGVRAYPSGEGSGDEGWLARAEWRLPLTTSLPGAVSVMAFGDAGGVAVNKRPWAPSPAGNNDHLAGAGVGVEWSTRSGLAASLVAAQRIGANAGQDAAGKDSDGRRERTRLWLNFSMSF